MKKLIVTICLAIITLTASAQCPISFHAKAGIGTSFFYKQNENSDTKIAYKAGVGAEYALSKTWVVQSALEFVSIGSHIKEYNIGSAKMNELYLQIPIMMAARLHLGNDYHASISAGPYFAVGVGGKTSGERYEYSSSSGLGTKDYRFKLDTFGNMIDGKMGNNRFDAGIALGITFEYRRVIIGAEAQVGLVTANKQLNQMINSNGYGEDFLPRNFASFFTLGYRFW